MIIPYKIYNTQKACCYNILTIIPRLWLPPPCAPAHPHPRQSYIILIIVNPSYIDCIIYNLLALMYEIP